MDNRSNILNHALHLFSVRGYDAVGVQEIVDETGITKPTLYHYFGSKRGLLEAMLSENFNPLMVLLREASDYRGDLPLTLKRITVAYFNFAQANPAFYRLQLGLWFAPQFSEGYQAIISYNQAQYALIEQVFIKAVVQHGNMRGRHQAYTVTFQGMINNYIALALNDLVQLEPKVIEQAVHQFQHGIYS